LILVTALLALALGMWTSAVNIKYRDVGVALPVLMQFLMFASPVVYSSNLVPEKWRALYSLNPIVGIVDNFRAAILGFPFRWGSLAITALITVVLLVYAAYEFRRMERFFADVI
jgi:lipopolysaccharide transport system permease protein